MNLLVPAEQCVIFTSRPPPPPPPPPHHLHRIYWGSSMFSARPLYCGCSQLSSISCLFEMIQTIIFCDKMNLNLLKQTLYYFIKIIIMFMQSTQHPYRMEWKPTDVTILFVYCWISIHVSGPRAHLQESSYSCSHNHWFSFCAALFACSVCCGLSWWLFSTAC